MNEIEQPADIEPFAAELIDRFGTIPEATRNLLSVIEIKLHARAACIAKLDAGQKGALVTFRDGGFPNVPGLLGYIDRLKGTAKLRPDNKLVIARSWADAEAMLNGALQLSRGLAKVAAA